MSYTAAASDKDRVRFRIGDTDTTDEMLADAEIADLLTDYPLAVATAKAARAAAAVLARKVNQSISGTAGSASSNRGSRYHNMMELATMLEKEAGGTGAMVPVVAGFAGGISEADNTIREADTDRVPPLFTRTLFQHSED